MYATHPLQRNVKAISDVPCDKPPILVVAICSLLRYIKRKVKHSSFVNRFLGVKKVHRHRIKISPFVRNIRHTRKYYMGEKEKCIFNTNSGGKCLFCIND